MLQALCELLALSLAHLLFRCILDDQRPSGTPLDHILHRFTRIVRGMLVNEERMRRNLDLGQGLVYSGQLLLELTARGMRREDAYRIVQAHAMEAWKHSGDFRKLVYDDPEIRKTLTEAELDEVFRLERYFDHVDAIFTRVFGAQTARGGSEPD